MKFKRILSLILALLLLLGFSGCRKKEEEQPLVPEVTEEDELVIYHNSKSLSPMLISLTEEYSKATGKRFPQSFPEAIFWAKCNPKTA